jgi:hypothetical protein
MYTGFRNGPLVETGVTLFGFGEADSNAGTKYGGGALFEAPRQPVRINRMQHSEGILRRSRFAALPRGLVAWPPSLVRSDENADAIAAIIAQ